MLKKCVTQETLVTDKRIGFCCKFVSETEFKDKKSAAEWHSLYNTKGTTVTSLEKLTRTQAIDKLCGIVRYNTEVLMRQFQLVGSWPQELRMMRIGSEILPARTHANWSSAYQESVMIEALRGFGEVGKLARDFDIRLSTHPGQFTMLVSHEPEVVERAIEDLEYHSEIFRLMGFDGSDQRQEINIHGGARRDDFLDYFQHSFARLSSDTKQWLSVENDEYSYGLDHLLPLKDKVKICLDINHYWIHQGTYLSPDDPRLTQVIESWRGARPEIHVAWPHEDVLPSHSNTTRPDIALLESSGIKRSKLRAHSKRPWNKALNSYCLEFWDRMDLMCEAKEKNLAARELYDYSQTL
jgi:UV damage endonuclease UvdE